MNRMASPETWLQLLAWTKALFEVTKATIDLTATYEKYRKDPETQREAARVSIAFSTYDEEEVDALGKRMSNCRTRFIEEGSGRQRAGCICSVLNDAKDGNGGTLPLIDDWQNIYARLNCGTSK